MHTSVYENMSKPEKEVCAHLRELNLWWHYEQPVFVYDHMERPRVWTPDLYIPELGICTLRWLATGTIVIMISAGRSIISIAYL